MRLPSLHRVFRAVAAICLVSVAAQAEGAPPEPAQAAPDATIHFHGRTASIGAGFSWGASTLEFQGKTYPVRVDGFVLGALGTATIDGSGEVYGLHQVEDLSGDYTAVSTDLAIVRGPAQLVMRNNKGVRIVVNGTMSGLHLGLGPRGFTLEVGEAGGPPADDSARLPQTLGFGELQAGPLFFKPTLNAQLFLDASHGAGFDGDWSFGDYGEVNSWLEHSNEVGLNARYPIGEAGTLLGRVSGVYSMTASGPEGSLCSGHNTNSEYTLESAYLGWKSGNLFPTLGFNAVELSGGNQNYQVGDGLLFWDGGQDCSGRGANWLSPRKAFRETAIARLTTKHFTFEAAHLKYNDDPNTHTRLGLGRIEYVTDEGFLEHLKLGVMYFGIYESDTSTRDGMDGIYVYADTAPLRVLPNFTMKGSFVRENNSKSSGLTEAYAWNLGGAYQLKDVPWTPQLGYRYAWFSGGSNRAFDSLFTGLPDWGTWFQGELLGEFALSNSNLKSHQVRLTLKPSDTVTVNLIYYKFLLDRKDEGFGITPDRVNRNLADEVDLIVDVAMTNWWSITGTFAVAHPNSGFQQAVDGSAAWINGYLYMNFNF